jgi:hypothetical protein
MCCCSLQALLRWFDYNWIEMDSIRFDSIRLVQIRLFDCYNKIMGEVSIGVVFFPAGRSFAFAFSLSHAFPTDNFG